MIPHCDFDYISLIISDVDIFHVFVHLYVSFGETSILCPFKNYTCLFVVGSYVFFIFWILNPFLDMDADLFSSVICFFWIDLFIIITIPSLFVQSLF